MPIPDTKYAKAGDASIAYQVYGSGEHRAVAVRAPSQVPHQQAAALPSRLLRKQENKHAAAIPQKVS